MFKLESEEALLAAFRPKDRKLVELSSALNFPVNVRDYIAWSHPAGGRVCLVFAAPGGLPTGILFDTNGDAGGPVPQMCDWCHHTGTGTQVGLLTTYVNGKKRVGLHLCSDLSCKQKLEDEANRSGASVVPAMNRLIERMGRFAREALKIDLRGSR
ncbi:MAG TPA: FBP domain-containing protein [Myxococcaceae bacterium]|nr:FBP domain-containing protein [Myxococcaceae bacterium]